MAFEDLRYPPAAPFHETKALQRAILGNSPKKVRFLLRQGSNVNVPCGRKRIRPLMLACYVEKVRKREKIVDMLLQAGAAPGMFDCDGRNALFYACALEREDMVSKILRGVDFDLAAKDRDGNTVLHACAMVGVPSILGNVLVTLTKYGVDVNQRNALKLTPLAAALLCENLECAVVLHKFGACPRYSEEDLQMIFSAIDSEQAARAFVRSDSVVRDSILVASKLSESPLPSMADLLPFRRSLNGFHCLPLPFHERTNLGDLSHSSLLTVLDRSSASKCTRAGRKVPSQSRDVTSAGLNRMNRLSSSRSILSDAHRESRLSSPCKDMQRSPSSAASSVGCSSAAEWQSCDKVIRLLQEKLVPAQRSHLFPVITQTQVAVSTEWVDAILALKPPPLTSPEPCKERTTFSSAKKKILVLSALKKNPHTSP